MSDMTRLRPAEVSRRATLRRLALTAGGAVALAATVHANRAAAAETKVTQTAAGYQAGPHGAESCDSCRQFDRPAACKIVEGVISPGGWCKLYQKKPA